MLLPLGNPIICHEKCLSLQSTVRSDSFPSDWSEGCSSGLTIREEILIVAQNGFEGILYILCSGVEKSDKSVVAKPLPSYQHHPAKPPGPFRLFYFSFIIGAAMDLVCDTSTTVNVSIHRTKSSEGQHSSSQRVVGGQGGQSTPRHAGIFASVRLGHAHDT